MSGQHSASGRPVEILLIEDNPGDVRLTIEAFKDAKVRNNLTIAANGIEALEILTKAGKYANAAKPDLILLDLNLPLKDSLNNLLPASQCDKQMIRCCKNAPFLVEYR